MKNAIKFLIVAAGVAMLAGCAKEQAAQEGRAASSPVTFTVKANLPDLLDEDGTKLSLSAGDTQMKWEGGETMYVCFAKIDGTAVKSHVATITGGTGANAGTFSGPIDFGETGLTASDLIGIVFYRSTPTFELNSGKIRIKLGGVQNWSKWNPGKITASEASCYALLTGADLVKDGDNYSIDNVGLKCAKPLVRLNIYDTSGKYSGRKISKTYLGADYIHGTTAIWADGSGVTNSGNQYNFQTITFAEPVTMPSTKADAISVYVPIYKPRSVSFKSSYVVLSDSEEDQTVYKVFGYEDTTGKGSPKSKTVESGTIYTINLDYGAANAFSALEYSVDGGNSWSTDLPEAEYSSLSVRSAPGMNTLSSAKITEIRANIDEWGSDSGVTLDLGRARLSNSSTYAVDNKAYQCFPAAFGNSTAANACQKLRGLILPENTASLYTAAFQNCANLESVRGLENVKIFYSSSMRNTAITSADLSSAVSIGPYAFAGCTKMEHLSIASTVVDFNVSSNNGYNFLNGTALKDVYFDASLTPYVDGTHVYGYKSGSTYNVGADYKEYRNADNLRIFQFNPQPTEQTEKLTFTFGPNTTCVPGRMFVWNYNLDTIICLSQPYFGNYCIQGCDYLKRVELRSQEAPVAGSTKLSSVSTAPVPTNVTLVIPGNKDESDYDGIEPWKTLIENYGWTIETSTEW